MTARTFRNFDAWIGNVLIGALLLLVFVLLGAPFQARAVLEAKAGYPSGAVLLKPTGFPSGIQDAAARASLSRLEESGHLGYWTARESRPGVQPSLSVSPALASLGLLKVESGLSPANNRDVLAMAGGPYVDGTMVQEATDVLRVTGTASVPWLPTPLGDTTVLKVQTIQTIRADQIPTLVLGPGTDAATWLTTAQQAFGLAYVPVILSAELSQGTHYMENARTGLQRRMTVVALALLLITLIARLNLIWYQRRERLRIERMLGRSQRAFYLAWFRLSLSRWFWGALCAPLLALLLSRTGQMTVPLELALWTWLSVGGAGLLLTSLLGLSLRRVPLGKAGMEQRQTWTQWALPALVTALLVFSIPVLGARAAQLWLQHSAVVRALGEDTLVALTLPTARSSPTTRSCPAGISCVSVGWSNIYLWTADLHAADLSGLSSLGRFRPQDAAALGLNLTEGRLPRGGERGALITQGALNLLRTTSPSFGLGSKLRQGYHIVGVVSVPPHDGVGLFADMRFYDAAIFIPWEATGLETATMTTQDLFLSPLGSSAVLMYHVRPAMQSGIQRAMRARLGGIPVEFYRPAQYAGDLARSTRTSLLWLSALVVVGIVLAAGTYAATLQLVMQRRAREISVWRMLGMHLGRVRSRIGRPLFLSVMLAFLAGLAAALALSGSSVLLTTGLAVCVGGGLLAGCALSLVVITALLSRTSIDQAFRETM